MDIATRHWRFEIGVFLLLNGLPSKANESHLPGCLPHLHTKIHIIFQLLYKGPPPVMSQDPALWLPNLREVDTLNTLLLTGVSEGLQLFLPARLIEEVS